MIEDGKKLKLDLEFTSDEIIDVIKQMCCTAKQTHGTDVLDGEARILMLLTGGNGDFSIYINVSLFFLIVTLAYSQRKLHYT